MEIPLDISNKRLAKGTPCQTTLVNAEYQLSAECLLMVAKEMRESEYYALSQDAGHRSGLEHLVKMISYPKKDKDGHLCIGNFCLDIDASGKTAQDTPAGIEK